MKKGGLFWRTIKHLQARQAAYQVINRLRSRPKLRLPKTSPVSHFLPVPKADKPVSWSNGTFTFLNQSVNFLYSNEDADATTNEVDWNYAAYGKLWTYNLNYFDFLNQPDLPIQQGLWLIQSFIKQTHRLNDGLEPYPTSLRVVNWMQFLSRNQIQDESINCHLVAQVDLVSRRLEYHLA